MPVRKLRPEEVIDALKIQSIAFTFEKDFSIQGITPEQANKDCELIRGFFSDDGKLCSCLYNIPFEVRFDNHTVKMAGIGGVASLPEERNSGNIRSLFRYCFDEMMENQQIFSFLYPFSNIYYRQFGYESSYRRTSVTIPLDSFKAFRKHGKVRHYLPGEDSKDIMDIYSMFIQNKNMSVVRQEKQWENLIGKDPYKARQYTYVWYNDAGQPMSYVVFLVEGNTEFNMQVKELIWLNHDSLSGLLGFLNKFTPHYKNFKCSFPEYMNIHLMFPEPYVVNAQIGVHGMNRIVNLKKVLETMAYPECEGKLAIQVNDHFLEWNTGTFLITWNTDGVEVVEKDCPADLSCSIEVITQLATGYTGIEDYLGRDDIQVYGSYELLSSVFKKRQLFINDYF